MTFIFTSSDCQVPIIQSVLGVLVFNLHVCSLVLNCTWSAQLPAVRVGELRWRGARGDGVLLLVELGVRGSDGDVGASECYCF